MAKYLKYVIIKEKKDRFMRKNSSKAFSFAEVMITLVVVGVVSLLVIPNLLDDTTAKFNATAANKANYDVNQAALILQARCPRHRACNDDNSLEYNLSRLLNDNGDIKYKFNGNNVIVDVDNDMTTDLHYTLHADGTVTEDNDCSRATYKGNGCSNDVVKTFSSANNYRIQSSVPKR